MKKFITTSLLAVSLATGAFAQGYVAWNGSPSVNLIAQTNSATASGLSAGLGGGDSNAGGTTGNVLGGGSAMFYFVLLVTRTARPPRRRPRCPAWRVGLIPGWS